MNRLSNNMNCLPVDGNPQAGQILSTDGTRAVWINRDPNIDEKEYAGAIRWTGSEAAIILSDGSNGRTVMLFSPEQEKFNGCCKAAPYFLYKREPLCVLGNGKPGQVLVYTCGKYQWVDAPEVGCDCVGYGTITSTYQEVPETLPKQDIVEININVPNCLCDGLHILTIDVEAVTVNPA